MFEPDDDFWIYGGAMLLAGALAMFGHVETALAIDVGVVIVALSRFPWVA